jgi:hypothetical protein
MYSGGDPVLGHQAVAARDAAIHSEEVPLRTDAAPNRFQRQMNAERAEAKLERIGWSRPDYLTNHSMDALAPSMGNSRIPPEYRQFARGDKVELPDDGKTTKSGPKRDEGGRCAQMYDQNGNPRSRSECGDRAQEILDFCERTGATVLEAALKFSSTARSAASGAKGPRGSSYSTERSRGTAPDGLY